MSAYFMLVLLRLIAGIVPCLLGKGPQDAATGTEIVKILSDYLLIILLPTKKSSAPKWGT